MFAISSPSLIFRRADDFLICTCFSRLRSGCNWPLGLKFSGATPSKGESSLLIIIPSKRRVVENTMSLNSPQSDETIPLFRSCNWKVVVLEWKMYARPCKKNAVSPPFQPGYFFPFFEIEFASRLKSYALLLVFAGLIILCRLMIFCYTSDTSVNILLRVHRNFFF